MAVKLNKVEGLNLESLLGSYAFGKFSIGGMECQCEHNDFQKLSNISQGNFAIVSMFKHVKSGHKLAIKKQMFVLTDNTNNNNTEERVMAIEEIKLLQKTNTCKYIINFCGAYIHEGCIYIGEELMLDNMRYVLQRTNALKQLIPENMARKVAYSVIHALKFMLGIGYLHRDIKPSNILVGHGGEIKICDMGIAGMLREGGLAETNVGTLLYMPPERFTYPPIKGYTFSSDVWAFGITLLEVATGVHPYRSADNKDPTQFDMFQHSKDPCPVPPNTLSNELQLFIAKCMCKDHKLRPAYEELLLHPFLADATDDVFNVSEWYDHITDAYNNLA